MNNPEDCPDKSNDELRAEFVDMAVADELVQNARLTDIMRLAAEWKKELPKAQAANAERLHTHNIAERRAACDEIDEHRATDEGRAVYNAKRRDEYVPVGPEKRTYVTGLSEEEKKERRRQQKRASDKKAREKTPTPVKSAKRAASRKRKKLREAEATEQDMAARRIF